METRRKSAQMRNRLHNATKVKVLLQLDDMALYEIMKTMPIVDLTNLMETCKRMNKLVHVHLQKHHASVHWAKHSEGNVMQPSESERVFKHIGRHIRTIKLNMWGDFQFYEILVILAQYCPQLDMLILESIRMSRPLTLCDPFIRPLFCRLKTFVLSGCFWRGWCPLDMFFGINKTLAELFVINCCAYNGSGYRLQLAGFRSLKKLRLVQCRNVVTERELQVCFENNDIESLVLHDIGNVNIYKDKVIDHLSDTIEDLTIDFFNELSAHQILRLKNLKILRLRCNVYTNIDDLLLQIGMDSIEDLSILRLCISSTTIDALKQFKNLKRLRLDHVMNSVPRQLFRAIPKILPQLEQLAYGNSRIRDEDILHMFKLMPQLTRLSLLGCNSLATKTIFEMINILENDWHRPKLEFVPPIWETMKSFVEVKNAKKKMWLRTETTMISQSSAAQPSC